jgi:hypothetical protein
VAKYRFARKPLAWIMDQWKPAVEPPTPSEYEVLLSQIRDLGPVGLGLITKYLSFHREACSQTAEQSTSYACERALGAMAKLRWIVAELEALADPPAPEPSEEP